MSLHICLAYSSFNTLPFDCLNNNVLYNYKKPKLYKKIPSFLDLIYYNISNNDNIITDNKLFLLLKKQITEEFDKNNLLDSGYYDKTIKNNKKKLGSNYNDIQDIRIKQLNYLQIYDTILINIKTECIIEKLETPEFIQNQIHDTNYPAYLINLLKSKINERIIELNNIIDNIKKLINNEKKSLNLQINEHFYNIIENNICFSIENKRKLHKIRNIRYNHVLEYEYIFNIIKEIIDDYEIDIFINTQKIKQYLPDDLKSDLNYLLENKKKFLEIYDKIENIDDWDETLLETLNSYKDTINQLYFDTDKHLLETLINEEYQKTLLFLNYKKIINEETQIQNLIKNNRGSLIYAIRNDDKLDWLQKEILIDEIIIDKIKLHMDELYDELSILIDKKTFFSIHKTNIVHLILQQIDQEYLNNGRNINTIFTKFLNNELNNAINDYSIKCNILDSRNNNNLENQQNWKKIITDNKFIISNYENYKNYFKYKLNDDISLDYTEKFITNEKVIIAKQKTETKFKIYNKNFYEYLLKEMTNENDINKFNDNGFFDKEINILNDDFLEGEYKTSILQEFRKQKYLNAKI